MTEQPLVSIIIPTYNRAELIGETLDSVLAQTYQNWECIVVDDGSTDHTSDVLDNYTKKDSRISYHHRPKQYKPGGNGARNYGFDLSKGEYINWFDSDDVMSTTYLIEVITKFEKSDLAYVITKLGYMGNYNYLKESKFETNGLILHNYVSGKINILTNNIIFKTFFLQQNYLRFNEDLKAAQEWELFCKIFSYDKANFDYISKIFVHNRIHNNNISNNPKSKYERFYNYIIARRIIRDYLIKKGMYSKNLKNIFNETNKKFIIELLRDKKYKLINKALFFTGFTINNIKSFLSVYFFIITKRNLSRTKFI
ncbi:glycosyltransferase family 2 protein [Empedobacter falsenii]